MSSTSGLPDRLKKCLGTAAANQGCFKSTVIEAGLLMFLEASQKEKDRVLRLLRVYK